MNISTSLISLIWSRTTS